MKQRLGVQRIGWFGVNIVISGIDMEQRKGIEKPIAMTVVVRTGKRGIIWLMRGSGERS